MVYRWTKILLLVLAFYQLSPKGMGCWAALLELETPIRSIVAIVDADARPAFLGELRKFAEMEDFSIRAGQFDQSGTHFIVQILRQDVYITILNPFPDPREVRFYFYQVGTQPVPDATVDALAKHLTAALSLVVGVAFQ